jgi:simple sugar transport system ATP-binding protein
MDTLHPTPPTEATRQPVPAVEPGQMPAAKGTPVLEARGISKYFGRVVALENVSLVVRAGEVNCLLGDNGAGKSTLIKILSGVHQQDAGELLMYGRPLELRSPREALDRGIATVYQDLALQPLMSVSRNFFVGSEPTRGWGPFRLMNMAAADRIAAEQMAEIGIAIRDTSQLVGTLSGGERQTLAAAPAEYFGARVLLLDEPTSALGVRQATTVLQHIVRARNRGLAIVFITDNPEHALPVGDSFTFLRHGRPTGVFQRGELNMEQILIQMGGGDELEELARDLAGLAGRVK